MLFFVLQFSLCAQCKIYACHYFNPFHSRMMVVTESHVALLSPFVDRFDYLLLFYAVCSLKKKKKKD